MDYTCRNTIIQNMRDFGCDENVIKEFLVYFDKDDRCGQKRILKQCRKEKLDELHAKQKEIDLLDYMVYQLDKCSCSCTLFKKKD